MFSSNTTQVSDGGYQISRSLRFNSADSAYLNRTPASASNQKTFTWSGWVKRGALGGYNTFFNAGNNGFVARFNNPTNYLEVYNYSGGYQLQVITAQVFRDVSAWYHIVFVVDTTPAADSSRFKLYINGVQVTSFYGTPIYPNQNADLLVNAVNVHVIGNTNGQVAYNDGLLTEVNFIDGQALTPSSFGETNAQTGVWGPKAYSGSYGTNGFYLNFSDNSNTTAATLGKDYSGNGNNWTPNNFSVTAGAGNDSLVDSPTSYGTDTGVGGTVRGNYCTLNPVDTISTVTLANGNLDYTGSSGLSIATFGFSSGKWYWEHKIGAVDYCVIGIYQSGSKSMGYLGQTGVSIGIPNGGSPQYAGVSAPTGTLAAFTSADTIGFALDLDAGTFTVYRNNVSSLVFSGLTGLWFPAQGMNYSASGIYNFGQRPFAYTAPSGFKALCTQNLPTPTIGATTATQAGKYFNAVTYTGTGSSLGVTGVGFQPDWVWVKSRSAATDHALYDAIRGVQKQIETNTTTAETTETTGLTAFGSDGFTTGALAQMNTSAATYVSWNWKANGAGSSNTAGSITSTVSASTTSGFSVVTYTGQSAAGTVGHGLGVAPSMIIVKSRSNSAYGWAVWHSSFTQSEYLLLETTDAKGTASNYWNSSAPSTWSSAFGVGAEPKYNNNSGDTFVAYCFAPIAGYSAFGSYTGNGSSDGPFVYCGFRPAYVMIKATGGTGLNWGIWDVARNTYNLEQLSLYANSSTAEINATDLSFDGVSNGFKVRGTSNGINQSGITFIFMAFAESPFKYALAR